MNLFTKLQEREAEGRPITVGLIGAGKFGTMYIHQALRTPGVHLVGIADLSPTRAIGNLKRSAARKKGIGLVQLMTR